MGSIYKGLLVKIRCENCGEYVREKDFEEHVKRRHPGQGADWNYSKKSLTGFLQRKRRLSRAKRNRKSSIKLFQVKLVPSEKCSIVAVIK